MENCVYLVKEQHNVASYTTQKCFIERVGGISKQVDKLTCLLIPPTRKAKKGIWRISEATLLLMAFLDSNIGAWLGMKAFHHKTMHKKFYIGVPTIIILQLAFAAWLAYKCLAA